MRIACPVCGVEYDVPDTRLRPGRLVRCARCDQEWEPAPVDVPQTAGFTTAEADLPFSAPVELRTSSTVAGPDKRLRVAWMISGLVIALLFGSAQWWRNAVMSGWPASQRLYALVGVHPAASPAAASPGRTANTAQAAHH